MTATSKSRRQCNVVGCEIEQEFADLTLPPEATTWWTEEQPSLLVQVGFCEDHWKQLEDAVQSESVEKIPLVNPDLWNFVSKGILPLFSDEAFRATKYESWKQSVLKDGRKFRNQEHETVCDVINNRGRVMNDADLSKRFVSLLVDEGDIPFGPAEQAKYEIKSTFESIDGIIAEVVDGVRADLVVSTGDTHAVGDVIWIGEDVLEEGYSPMDCPIHSPRDSEWKETLRATLDVSDVLGYGDRFVEKVFRVFVFDPLSEFGFVGLKNPYTEESDRGFINNDSLTSVPALMYGDSVCLPPIDDFPEFLKDESTFEYLQQKKIESISKDVLFTKKLYEYLRANLSR